MDNQPGPEQLQQSLVIAGTQLSRLPNMPVLDLASQIRALQEVMREEVRQLRVVINQDLSNCMWSVGIWEAERGYSVLVCG